MARVLMRIALVFPHGRNLFSAGGPISKSDGRSH